MAESETQPPTKKTVATPTPQHTTSGERIEPQSDPSTPPHVPPSPPQKRRTHTCKPDQTPWWKVIIEVVALLTVIAYTIATWRQLRDFEHATRDATQAQILMKMPLVITEDTVPNWNNTAPKDHPSIWVVQFFGNIGETRATGVNIIWGWGHDLPSVRFEKKNVIYERLVDNIWVPGTTDGQVEWIWVPNHVEKQRVIMPIDEARDLATLKKPLYVYAQIRYLDIFPPDDDFGLRGDHLVEYCIQITSFDIGEKTNGVSTTWGGKPCPGRAYCTDKGCPEKDYYPYTPES